MSNWKDKLLPTQVQCMQEILVQIPEDFGARAVFEGILNKLAEGPKFRYIVTDIDDPSEVVGGTNDPFIADHINDTEQNIAIDTLAARVEVQAADYGYEDEEEEEEEEEDEDD